MPRCWNSQNKNRDSGTSTEHTIRHDVLHVQLQFSANTRANWKSGQATRRWGIDNRRDMLLVLNQLLSHIHFCILICCSLATLCSGVCWEARHAAHVVPYLAFCWLVQSQLSLFCCISNAMWSRSLLHLNFPSVDWGVAEEQVEKILCWRYVHD